MFFRCILKGSWYNVTYKIINEWFINFFEVKMMKKISKFTTLLIAFVLLVLLTAIYIFMWLFFGETAGQSTLFALLKSVDWPYFGVIFGSTTVYFLLLDLLSVFLVKHLRKGTLSGNFWTRYRRVHLTYLLLTIFLTIAISAPSSLMNTFTAIVSISVLVSNFTKPVDK